MFDATCLSANGYKAFEMQLVLRQDGYGHTVTAYYGDDKWLYYLDTSMLKKIRGPFKTIDEIANDILYYYKTRNVNITDYKIVLHDLSWAEISRKSVEMMADAKP